MGDYHTFVESVSYLYSKCKNGETEHIAGTVQLLKTLLSGNTSFMKSHSEESGVDGECMLKSMESDFGILGDITNIERSWAMEKLIDLANCFPRPVYDTLQYKFEDISEEERDQQLAMYRQLSGDKVVDDFVAVCKEIGRQNKKVVLFSCTFWGGGIAPMLHSGGALIRSLGVDLEWHMMWVSTNSFFVTCKSIHNIVMGTDHAILPKWQDYYTVNKENERLYSKLREMERGRLVFFYEDPQPAGQPINSDDISVLHIDTNGTNGEHGSKIWSLLTSHWSKGKVLLHQPFSGGFVPLLKGMVLVPGINLLSPKNIPRSSREEAILNIRNAKVVDCNNRAPKLETNGMVWMLVGRPDPAKGQIPGLLAFIEDLLVESSALLWFFVQYEPSDIHALIQLLVLKILIEDTQQRSELVDQLTRLLNTTADGNANQVLSIISAAQEKIHSKLPQGVRLFDHVQIFTNLSVLLGDFAALASAHLVLSVREGYNLVISEMARHSLPVIANDYPPFRDRVISGKRGGWLVTVPPSVLNSEPITLLRHYCNDHAEINEYIFNIASWMNFIRENPKKGKQLAANLNAWVMSEGHILRYHLDRLAVVLALNEDLVGFTKASQITSKVVSRLRT